MWVDRNVWQTIECRLPDPARVWKPDYIIIFSKTDCGVEVDRSGGLVYHTFLLSQRLS